MSERSGIDGATGTCERPASDSSEFRNVRYRDLVPRDPLANLRFRLSVYEQCEKDPEFAADIWQMCRDDLVFFAAVFIWIDEPRDRRAEFRKLPFIPWPAQEELLDMLAATYAIDDCGVEKSRDVGASYCILVATLHAFIFDPDSTHLMISATEELVWNTGDPKALFTKIDHMLAMLHSSIRPNVNPRVKRYLNLDNGASIVGASTTEDAGRSGRCTTIFIDEATAIPFLANVMLAVNAVSNCKRLCATPKGMFGEYYRFIKGTKHRFTFKWTRDPRKTRGMYRGHPDGRIEKLDGTHKYDPSYPFVLDGRERSIWYDKEEKRYGANKRGFAQEVDLSYEGSASLYYGMEFAEEIIRRDCRAPFHVGEISWLTDSYEFRGFKHVPGGRWKLWLHSDPHENMPRDRSFVVGVDVSAGTLTGYSNSVIAVVDTRTGEKVAEFADPRIMAHELAAMAVATCRWFSGQDEESGGAYLIWDANGPTGTTFTKCVVSHYGRIFYRKTNEQSIDKRESKIPGFWTDTKSRRALHSELRRMLTVGDYIERSEACAEELKQYVNAVGDQVEHVGSLETDDPSGAKASHGDRVIATAIALRGWEELGFALAEKDSLREQPVNSYATRRRKWVERSQEGSNRYRSALNGVTRHAGFH